jgi:hypothetical protein
MQFCSQCGQGNADDAGFCVQCGAPVGGQQQVGASAGVTPPPSGPVGSEGPPPPPMPPGQTPWSGSQPPGAPVAPGVPGAPGAPGMPPGPGMPPPGYYHRQPPTDGMAIASLVSGIAGWFFCPIIGGVLAIIFGYMAKKNINESNGALTGDPLATAGIILGFVQLGIVLVVVVIWIIIAIVASTTNGFGLVMPALLAGLGLL